MRIKVTAYICDACGKRVPEEQESTITQTVIVSGPDSDLHGSYDLCDGCGTALARVLGVGHHPARPKAKRKPAPKKQARGGARTPWTHLEVDEVMRGMAEGLDADQIAAKLPGRTAKAVTVRMGLIRKDLDNAATPVNLENLDT
jgi:hypothetical protein